MLPYKDPAKRREFMKIYHKKNDNRIKRARKLKQRLMLDRIKLEVGCQKCGYRVHPVALQFHHRDRKTKSFTISTEIGGPIMRILKETEKCDVLWAICHVIEEYRLNENSLY